MKPLRHLLLVIALVFAQLAVGVHAIGHATGDDDALPTHTCELCLAAHDLGSALPSLPATLPLVALQLLPEVRVLVARAAFPPPLPVQRGPPLA